LDLADADSAEHGTASGNLVIAPVSCPVPDRPEGAPRLFGARPVRILPGSRLFDIYRSEQAAEEYFCNYEVNPRYRDRLDEAGLKVSALGEAGEVRAVELPGHCFFIATLFQPQLSSAPDRPHAFIIAYLEAALRRRGRVG
jgi:CTP synthase (UTP-ammonia lyase)